MYYLTRMLGKPVVDAAGETIGSIHDLAIATGEIFPRVTALAFVGPDKTPFMLSWRKFVATFGDEGATLNVAAPDLRFSYLQPDEVLLARDLLNKQIVDTQGMKVVRVNDLKLSESRSQLRLLGAEVGARGVLRGIWPPLETAADRVARLFGRTLGENLIAWNYMDLLDRDLSHVKLSVTHKRLHELHPADVADVLEQLSAAQRAKVFEHLDNDQAAEAISELEDELQAEVLDDLTNQRASDILEIMDPDDAADIIGDLPYDKAEALLRLMGVHEARQVRQLLGYKEKTAGGIMTPEVTTVTGEMTVEAVIEHLRTAAADNENIYYIYVVGPKRTLEGVVSLRDLIVSAPGTPVSEILERDVFSVGPDDDQEVVADQMSKYDLLAIPVVDEQGRLLGMVTVDDALDVMAEESAEDLELATGRRPGLPVTGLMRWVSRDGWLPVWAGFLLLPGVIARVTGDTDGMALGLIASVLMALPVLRFAEDAAAHAMSRVISGELDGERTPVWRRFLDDAAAGALIGIVAGLIAWGAIILAVPQPPEGLDTATAFGFAGIAGALGVSTFAITLLATAAGLIAEARARADKRVSQAAVSITLQVLGGALFVALTVAAALLAPAMLAG